MARFGWSMTGSKELEEYYRSLPKYVREEVLEDAVTSGALILANAVKRIARDKKILLSGTLIRSYHIGGHMSLTPDAMGGKDYSDIGGVISGNDSYSVLVGTNLPYARRQEFGFESEDSRGRTYHQPARPHLRAAFDTERDQVKDEMVDTFRVKLMQYRAA
jgi:hypothetical protein